MADVEDLGPEADRELARLSTMLSDGGWKASLGKDPVTGETLGLMADRGVRRVVVSIAPLVDDDQWWIHASISRRDKMPTYADLQWMHETMFGQKHAYQVFVPAGEHINIHPRCLHLWGRFDGSRALPNFGILGTI